MNAREALTKLRDWVRLTAAAELFGKDVRPLAWLVGPKDVLTEIDRLLAELPEAEPVTDAEVVAAIARYRNAVEESEKTGNRFDSRRERAVVEFTAAYDNLHAIIARRVAEERVHDAAELRAENARLRLEIGLLESRMPPEPAPDEAREAIISALFVTANRVLHRYTDADGSPDEARAEVASLRERAEMAERERDEVTRQLNGERADHVRIAVAAGVFYENDYGVPTRGPVDSVVKEIEALVKDRAAADRLRSLDQAVRAYRRKERELLGLPDGALEEDHLQAIARLRASQNERAIAELTALQDELEQRGIVRGRTGSPRSSEVTHERP